jgi:putative ABC transport system permease protein
MSWLKLLHRLLVFKPLGNLLSIIILAMGIGMIVIISHLAVVLDESFKKNIRGIDLVVGAKGSPLQLILAAVYHMDSPTGNIPLKEAMDLTGHPLVEKAIPLSLGDSYNGYRIVGTDTTYPAHYGAVLADGRLWNKSMEVTIGASVAANAGLQLGANFFGSHGLGEALHVHDDAPYTVVGILEPTGTVMDMIILTALESVWDVHADHHHNHNGDDPNDHHHHNSHHKHHDDHVHGPDCDHDHDDDHHHGETHEHQHGPDCNHDHDHHHESHVHGPECNHNHDDGPKEITALLIKFRNPMAMLTLPRLINAETSMQAALPAIEINRLFGLLGIGLDALRYLALFLVFIAAFSVFISLLNTLRENQIELAIIRAMGAGRARVFFLMQGLALLLALAGIATGYLLALLGLFGLQSLADQAFYGAADFGSMLASTWMVIPAVLGIAIVTALFPAIQAYRLNISNTLARES